MLDRLVPVLLMLLRRAIGQKQNTLQEDVELLMDFIPIIAVNKLVNKIGISKDTFACGDYVPGPEIFKQRQTDQRIKTRL